MKKAKKTNKSKQQNFMVTYRKINRDILLHHRNFLYSLALRGEYDDYKTELGPGICLGDILEFDDSAAMLMAKPERGAAELGYVNQDDMFILTEYLSDEDNTDYCYVKVYVAKQGSTLEGWFRFPTEYFDFFCMRRVKRLPRAERWYEKYGAPAMHMKDDNRELLQPVSQMA